MRCAAHARDEPDAQRHGRQGQATVRVDQALLGQCGERALPVGSQAAERERRVDRHHPQLQPTAGSVPPHASLDADLDAVVHPHRATLAGEEAVDVLALGGEQGDGHLCAHGDTLRHGLDEVEVDVAVLGAAQVADLALDPDVARERARQQPLQVRAELADPPRVDGVIVAVPFRLEPRQHARKVQARRDRFAARVHGPRAWLRRHEVRRSRSTSGESAGRE